MQTFLPRASFSASAAELDEARLNKQITECWQILLALTEGTGYVHHPATKMWAGYERALCLYGQIMSKEWTVNRGRRYTDVGRFTRLDRQLSGHHLETDVARWAVHTPDQKFEMPPWLGDPAVHGSHRSNLVRKNAQHYGPKYPGQPDNRPYIWPVLRDPYMPESAPEYFLVISAAEMKRKDSWELPASMFIATTDAKGRALVRYKED